MNKCSGLLDLVYRTDHGQHNLDRLLGTGPQGWLAQVGRDGRYSYDAPSVGLRMRIAALLDVICAPERGAPYVAPPHERPYLDEVGASPGKLRIALQTTAFNEADVHDDCVAAAEETANLLRELGHEVVPATVELEGGRRSRFVCFKDPDGTVLELVESA